MRPGATPSAEAGLLAKLLRKPAKIFEIDGRFMDEHDLASELSRCLYSALRAIAGSSDKIDPVLLEEKVASLFPKYYSRNSDRVHGAVGKLGELEPGGKLSEYVKAILSKAIKGRSLEHLSKMRRRTEELQDHREILSELETKTVEFCIGQMKAVEVIKLGEHFDDFVALREKRLQEGKRVGVSSGYHYYDEAIGGGHRPGAIDIVVARAKTGKSIYALNVAHNVSSCGVPVLYLDTELPKDQQMVRLISVASEVPIWYLDHGKFLRKEKYRSRVQEHRDAIKKLPLSYVEVKGWKLQKQMSVIRSWHARNVGRSEDGSPVPALVILDYLKIMDPSDKGFDMKEWEALGYYLSALHDLVGELRIPMLAMAQQNRMGIEEEHEGTVAGSDRLTWFCDSLSILMTKRMEDLEAEYEDPDRPANENPSNMKMKVKMSRFGAGNPGNEYITFYSDIKNPRMNKKRMSGRIEEVAQESIRPVRRGRRGGAE